MATAIGLLLSNAPLILFSAAFLIAFLAQHPDHYPTRLLRWLLLLSVGVDGVWAGIFHIFFPGIASSSIGWAPSPFEFEIGVADAAIGITAIVSFWRNLDFKGAVVWYSVLFYAGVTIGHLHQAISAHDYSANNFGILLILTVARMVLLPVLYVSARRHASAP